MKFNTEKFLSGIFSNTRQSMPNSDKKKFAIATLFDNKNILPINLSQVVFVRPSMDVPQDLQKTTQETVFEICLSGGVIIKCMPCENHWLKDLIDSQK